MSTEIAMSLTEMSQLAKAVAASKLFGMQTPEQALVLMALCRSEGKDPIQAVRQYHIINGKPSMRADAMLGEFQYRGGKVQWGERSNTLVSGTFSHPSGGDLTVTWTIKDAQEAGLTGNPTWKKFPRQMLTARVISEAIRTVLPGVVAGIYAPEEVEDFEPPRPSTRQPVPKTIEPPAGAVEAPPSVDQSAVDQLKESRAVFFVACDARDLPFRGVDRKPIPDRVMAVLHYLGWPDTAPPASAADWASSAAVLQGADTEQIDKLRALMIPTSDLVDPFAEGQEVHDA